MVIMGLNIPHLPLIFRARRIFCGSFKTFIIIKQLLCHSVKVWLLNMAAAVTKPCFCWKRAQSFGDYTRILISINSVHNTLMAE